MIQSDVLSVHIMSLIYAMDNICLQDFGHAWMIFVELKH